MAYPVMELRGGFDAADVARAARALQEGGLVAMPTETVYGVFARAGDPQAVAALRTVKGRPETKPFAYAIADADDLRTFTNRPPRAALRLASRYWPGPLTLVVGPDGGVGVRCPDHEFVRAVVRAVDGNLVQTSANRSGEPPALEASSVQAALPDGLALLVDGGRVRGGTASSVVKIDPSGSWRVLREGAISRAELADELVIRSLLVCTGNTCRSPMAAALLADRLADALEVDVEDLEAAGYHVASAGVAAFPGSSLSAEAAQVLTEARIALPRGGARVVDRAELARADRVWVMTRGHLEALRRQFPEESEKATLFDPHGQDIPDPIGGSLEVYRDCYRELAAIAEERVRELQVLSPSS